MASGLSATGNSHHLSHSACSESTRTVGTSAMSSSSVRLCRSLVKCFMSLFFAIATAWTVSSLLWLGRSFSVLPARRHLVTTGPYALLRHPVYLGELLMLQVVGAASGSRAAQLICFAAIPLIAVRILAEERVMAHDPAWGAYTRRTRFRLVPWLW